MIFVQCCLKGNFFCVKYVNYFYSSVLSFKMHFKRKGEGAWGMWAMHALAGLQLGWGRSGMEEDEKDTYFRFFSLLCLQGKW